MSGPILTVDDLRVEIPTRRGVVHAVRGVSFAVEPGETFALVGESGSGKTMTCRAMLGLIHPPGRITGGRVVFEGRDLVRLPEKELAPTAELFARPRHPYTIGLIASVPSVDRNRPLAPIPGTPPDLIALGRGCSFAPRCPWASSVCLEGDIPLAPVGEDHRSRCLKADRLGAPVEEAAPRV